MTKVTAQTFWDAAYPMIAVTEQHPFLVSMVDGSLEEENFKYYVVQDALYLRDYADCLRRVAQKAPTPEDASRLNAFAKGAEVSEMELHNSFFKEWKIDAPKQSESDDPMKRMPNCLLYTSYIKRVVATESYAQGLSALLPCFWVYMHVGHVMLKLREKLDAEDPASKSNRKSQYDAWIDMYAGDEFVKEVTDYIAMVNAECDRIQSSDENDPQAALARMQQHFVMGCKLEHMFWDQASTCMQWPEIGGL
mmetsp:Transcript_18610/g.38335  ORF Transcript_18610/g.38335 Transcript_18610/m.38335 type:complete len:250 (-) Transcript_18610:309-1058(-)